MKCGICGAKEPVILPCHVRKKVYLSKHGLILAVADGCPSEDNDKPIYIDEEFLSPRRRAETDYWTQHALAVSYEDYENLWASWNREDHLFNKNPHWVLREWLSSFPDKLSFIHECSSGGDKATHRAAVHFLRLAEGLQKFQDGAFGVLPKGWYRDARNYERG